MPIHNKANNRGNNRGRNNSGALQNQPAEKPVPKPQTSLAYGVVTEALPNTLFRVRIENDKKDPSQEEEIVMAYLAGKMRMHRIKVLIGDKVELTLDSYGGRARITKRL